MAFCANMDDKAHVTGLSKTQTPINPTESAELLELNPSRPKLRDYLPTVGKLRPEY
jgi:hypothetical protein